MTPVRVLAVDDQPLFLDAARELIASTPGFELAGEARSGLGALAAADRLRPDLILMDVRLPGLDGIETARALGVADGDLVRVSVDARSVEAPVLITGLHAEGAATLPLGYGRRPSAW